MDTRVVVVRSFGSHARGDILTDASEMAKILASEQAANVVRVGTPPAAPKPNTATVATDSANAKGS